MAAFTILVILYMLRASVGKVEPEVKPPPEPIEVADAENNAGRRTNEKGEELFEGDMVIDKQSKGQGSDRNAINSDGGNKRWPKVNGIVEVPYSFMNTLSATAKKLVLESIADYAAWTCIKFVQRSNQKDYITFFGGNGCYSDVGRRGRGPQSLSLGRGCDGSKGTPTHEMMHALGFYHEQSRTDRDNYVSIRKENVMSESLYNFEICKDCKDPTNLPYDYNSVMHYGKGAFSVNKQDTIIPRKSGVLIGQRGGLCDLDIKKLNWMYECNGRTVSQNKPNGGELPCNVPYDRWTNCHEYTTDCANPRENYIFLENCPKTCAGFKKGDPYDEYNNCDQYLAQCSTDWGKQHCALTCSRHSG